ncbi:TPA: hypothetical protein VPA43_001812 [Streptococcus pyogenes]|uniref:hypothetical protein n=1 Tax=Priestia megaterium TaxID=1404 RepID=UPI001E312DA4|nr:hypothetical protein [Priestia megaterium]MCE4093359.1 hypothetical protein [Priestia megaterium]HES8073969.1 hypothetical protein [Streptococcus pyogenes]
MQGFEIKFACNTTITINDPMLDQFTPTQVACLQEYAANNRLSDVEKEIVKSLKLELEEFQKEAVINNKCIVFEDISKDELQFSNHAFERYAERVDKIPPSNFRGYTYPEEIEKINNMIDLIKNSTMIETKAEYKGEWVLRYNFIGELENEPVVISVKFEDFVVIITVIDKKNPN